MKGVWGFTEGAPTLEGVWGGGGWVTEGSSAEIGRGVEGVLIP